MFYIIPLLPLAAVVIPVPVENHLSENILDFKSHAAYRIDIMSAFLNSYLFSEIDVSKAIKYYGTAETFINAVTTSKTQVEAPSGIVDYFISRSLVYYFRGNMPDLIFRNTGTIEQPLAAILSDHFEVTDPQRVNNIQRMIRCYRVIYEGGMKVQAEIAQGYGYITIDLPRIDFTIPAVQYWPMQASSTIPYSNAIGNTTNTDWRTLSQVTPFVPTPTSLEGAAFTASMAIKPGGPGTPAVPNLLHTYTPVKAVSTNPFGNLPPIKPLYDNSTTLGGVEWQSGDRYQAKSRGFRTVSHGALPAVKPLNGNGTSSGLPPVPQASAFQPVGASSSSFSAYGTAATPFSTGNLGYAVPYPVGSSAVVGSAPQVTALKPIIESLIYPNLHHIKVRGSIYSGPNKEGDFRWMINQPAYYRTLFIFNDNAESMKAFEQILTGQYTQTDEILGCAKGGGNAVIRPYRCAPHPRAAAVVTGNNSRGYQDLAEAQEANVQPLAQIAGLLQTGNYDEMIFSVESDGLLGQRIFNIAQSIRQYLTDRLLSLAR